MSHVSDQHDRHDRLAVASLAAGDLAGTDRDRAASLVATCADCASLHDDLLAIARATAATPGRRQPARLPHHPGAGSPTPPAGWRRCHRRIRGSALRVTRQLGVGLATLGIAGLLLSALPPLQMGLARERRRPGACRAPRSQPSSERAPAFGAETDDGASVAPAALVGARIRRGRSQPRPVCTTPRPVRSRRHGRPTGGTPVRASALSGSSPTAETLATAQTDRLLAATADESAPTQGVSLVVIVVGGSSSLRELPSSSCAGLPGA